MAPIGEKMKQMGHNIKDALTPGSNDESKTTYTQQGNYGTTGTTGTTTTTTGATTGLTDPSGYDKERQTGTDYYAAGSNTGAYGTSGTRTGASDTILTGDKSDSLVGQGATTHSSHHHSSGVTGTDTGRDLGGRPMENADREGKGVVLGQDYYTGTEDRTRVVERVEQIREHRPVEKEYVVETRATGRERARDDQRSAEHLGTRERVVTEGETAFDNSRATGGEYTTKSEQTRNY